ncbi:hypothetical protein N7449_003462 [Penicillium cf. viridicatum]|uniref:AMMECR1 domain-containing protein n=1 Tax=Penicillium cf. viridicatum TaxID=2972119 RepID=A0A9W9MWZ1_9EURO|nr:hypothetical protein N7449_003462 [Penicillium cf. viridicatum]
MANTAQCYYCFESLLASFEDREPPTLAAVEALWEQHEQTKKLSSLEEQLEVDTHQQQSSAQEAATAQNQPSSEPILHLIQCSHIFVVRIQYFIQLATVELNQYHHTKCGFRTPQLRSPDQRYPLFVTWNTLSRSGHKSLRGCIGTFEGQELAAGLKSYALTSAFDDTRFEPIPKSLLPSLSCSLTLLGSFEPCTNALDWSLGTHGLRISFIHRGRRYGATYLPDVAVEQGWTKEETVESLMRKAGWDGGGGSAARRLLRGAAGGNSGATKPWDQVSDFRTVRYQGLKASASYAEWQEWREWVLSLDDGEEILEGTD